MKIKTKNLCHSYRTAMWGALLVGLCACSEESNKPEVDPSVLITKLQL